MSTTDQDVATIVDVCNASEESARQALQQYKGDVEKAINHILNANLYAQGSNDSTDSMPALVPVPTEDNPIDLSGDDLEDPELRKAMRLSIQQPKPQYHQDSKNWALVPSTNTTTGENDLHQAIARSLQDVHVSKDEDPPMYASQRVDGRPVALWSPQPEFIHVALVLQALFHVPQVKAALASVRFTEPGSETVASVVQEIFAHLELNMASCLHDDRGKFQVFEVTPLSVNESPGEKTKNFFHSLASVLGQQVPECYKYFNFGHAKVTLREPGERSISKNPRMGCVVLLPRAPTMADHDSLGIKTTSLMAGLTTRLSTFHENEAEGVMFSEHDVIYEPSDVIAFHLALDNKVVPDLRYDPFTFPSHLYLDPFLADNFDLSTARRKERGRMIADLSRLIKQRTGLQEFSSRDFLASLDASTHYFDHVAADTPDPARRKRVADKLRGILEHIEKETKEIDTRITFLQQSIANIFDVPEFQKHRYDLRAVLSHTGQYGSRKDRYSYLKDSKQRWWRMENYDAQQVSESDVLNDTTGALYGAGPYFLVYSRAVPPDIEQKSLEWPVELVSSIEAANHTNFPQPRTPEPSEPPTLNVTPTSRRKLPTPNASLADVTMQGQ